MSELRRAIERAGEIAPERGEAFHRLETFLARRKRRRVVRSLALGGALSLAGIVTILALLPLSGSGERPTPTSAPIECSPETIGSGPQLDPGWGPPGTAVTVTGRISGHSEGGDPAPTDEIQVWWNLDPERWQIHESLPAPPSLAPGSRAFIVARGQPESDPGCFRKIFRVPDVGGGAYPVLIGYFGGGGFSFESLAFDVTGPGSGGLDHITRADALERAVDAGGDLYATAEPRLAWREDGEGSALLVWRVTVRDVCVSISGPAARSPGDECVEGESAIVLDAETGEFIEEQSADHAGEGLRPAAPETIKGLPRNGIAVETPVGVLLHGLDGRVITELRGFELFNPTASPGPLRLQREHEYYALEPGQQRLRMLASRQAAEALSTADPGVDLPPAATHEGQPAGQWRYTIPSPDGSKLLAQWSGECEIPTAFLVDTAGGHPKPIAGRTHADAPVSFALGWTPRGEAIVLLPEAGCGSTGEEPGVYLFRDALHGRLLIPTQGFGWARVWRSG